MIPLQHEYHDHAAHCGATPYDVETWTYAQPVREPRPAGVPARAEYQAGHRDAQGVQHWTYVQGFIPARNLSCKRCSK